MKKILSFFIISLFILSSCTWGNNESYSSNTSKKNCIEPENPYSAGGHYEWFKWAESKWTTSCNGNSNSFNEWCSEYGRQLNAYNQCNK